MRYYYNVATVQVLLAVLRSLEGYVSSVLAVVVVATVANDNCMFVYRRILKNSIGVV